DERCPEPRGELVERAVDAADVVERRGGGRKQRAGAVAVIGLERQRPTAGRAAQGVDVTQPPAALEQPGVLIRAGIDALDLVELEGEQVELALARTGALAQLVTLRAQRPQGVPRLGAPGAAGDVVGAAEAVEQVELRRGERQLAVLVLAVER